MKSILNFTLILVIIFSAESSNSQNLNSSKDSLGLYVKRINDEIFVDKVSESILGTWVNKKNGIQISDSNFTMLIKQNPWRLSANKSDTYTFIGKPIANTETVFEVWVRNEKLNKEYINGNYEDVKTKQFRMVKFELQKNNELRFYFSNVSRLYDTDQTKLYVNGVRPDEGYIQYQTFKKLIEE